jgi:uncharacterized protein (TIGR01777 family)
VGSALLPALAAKGAPVSILTRGAASGAARIHWDPASGRLDPASLAGHDAVVHLAGENIAAGRWTAARKEAIRASRVDGTRLLATALARLSPPPRALICASAIGYYGDRGAEVLTESSAAGTGFLPEVCTMWEAAATPARNRGIRVAHARFGIILSARGGALAKMLTPFRLGAGGVLGSGAQYMSWISIDDAAGALVHMLRTESLSGAVNVVSPQPVTNREFTKALGRALGRPTIFPMPAFAARLAFGEMADALLLSSARVQPERLSGSAYKFRDERLDAALPRLLS